MEVKKTMHFCEEKKMKAYVKYNTFEKEQKKAWTKQIGRVENMFYEEELDEWICANKKRLFFHMKANNKQAMVILLSKEPIVVQNV